MIDKPLLQLEGAKVAFKASGGHINALDGVSMRVDAGETVALVGESGCGKTTLARAVLGLQPMSEGLILLDGDAVIGVSRERSRKVGMVWQDPFASLNPRWSVRRSVLEPCRIARRKSDVSAALERVGLDASFSHRYPHELSGGQRQRVAIARALSLNPLLVICDEPTASLDLSIRAQILNLLKDLKASQGCSFLYISHDLSTVRFIADRIAVMYLGAIVEFGPVKEVFESPMHPYTKALLDSAPTLETLGRLPAPPPGDVPDPRKLPIGCHYQGRCPFAQERCKADAPLLTGSELRQVACHFPLQSTAGQSERPA